MWELLRRYNGFEPRVRRIFLRAVALLPLLSLSLRVRGFLRTRASLQKHISSATPREFISPDLVVRMVRAAGQYGFSRPTCLQESLALWWILGRQGIASDLRVGVRKEGEKFEAHAWVECDGIALNEPESKHQHYAAFDSALASISREPR
jgi:hypothetical protein